MDATPEFYSINAESRSQDSGFIVSAKEAASAPPSGTVERHGFGR
jgi:hypothetical protein